MPQIFHRSTNVISRASLFGALFFAGGMKGQPKGGSSLHTTAKSVYFAVFCALVLLTALTVGVAFLNLGTMNPLAAMSIASLKAALVVFFFMHLRESSRLVRTAVVVGFACLLIMMALTLSDYWTRGWDSPTVGVGSISN